MVERAGSNGRVINLTAKPFRWVGEAAQALYRPVFNGKLLQFVTFPHTHRHQFRCNANRDTHRGRSAKLDGGHLCGLEF
jgi:hypothetical protein